MYEGNGSEIGRPDCITEQRKLRDTQSPAMQTLDWGPCTVSEDRMLITRKPKAEVQWRLAKPGQTLLRPGLRFPGYCPVGTCQFSLRSCYLKC